MVSKPLVTSVPRFLVGALPVNVALAWFGVHWLLLCVAVAGAGLISDRLLGLLSNRSPVSN